MTQTTDPRPCGLGVRCRRAIECRRLLTRCLRQWWDRTTEQESLDGCAIAGPAEEEDSREPVVPVPADARGRRVVEPAGLIGCPLQRIGVLTVPAAPIGAEVIGASNERGVLRLIASRFIAYDATSLPRGSRVGGREGGSPSQLQMLVTDTVLLVAAMILRLEKRPAPWGDGPSCWSGPGVSRIRTPASHPVAETASSWRGRSRWR